ncbi:MAG: hypothetical protein PVH74_06495 [Desulfobacterales bacterium]|jgi:hypothetical protein
MALQTLDFWAIILDVAQLCLCGLIILFLILNRIKFKQLILRAPLMTHTQNANTEFVVEAVRQQTKLAFNHIMETIDKERQTLDAYYQKSDQRIASGLFTSLPAMPHEPKSSTETSEPDSVNVIYKEIETLADQGLSLTDISERLNVPQGEVDLVLKLKHLRGGCVEKKNHPSV